ncbi:MAG: PfkB family carbohydrate kinase [Elusimicrobiota bacterium]|nr:MAG: PfkB family carbohydrate kinase [Elusimicrobiota bacterium]
MISFLRRHQKSIFVATISVFLCGSFVGFGGAWFTGRDMDGVAARIGRVKIPAARVQLRANQYADVLRDKGTEMDDAMMVRLRREMLNEMMIEELLAMKADELGLKVTNDQLAREIRGTPAFQQGGQFSQDAYFQQVRARFRETPQEYERGRRKSIKAGQLKQLFYRVSKPPVAEVEAAYAAALKAAPKKDAAKLTREGVAQQLQQQRAVELINYCLKQMSAQVEHQIFLDRIENQGARLELDPRRRLGRARLRQDVGRQERRGPRRLGDVLLAVGELLLGRFPRRRRRRGLPARVPPRARAPRDRPRGAEGREGQDLPLVGLLRQGRLGRQDPGHPSQRLQGVQARPLRGPAPHARRVPREHRPGPAGRGPRADEVARAGGLRHDELLDRLEARGDPEAPRQGRRVLLQRSGGHEAHGRAERAPGRRGPLRLGPVRRRRQEGRARRVHEGRLQVLRLPGLPLARIKDPTGAGDTFAGGFLGYLASTESYKDVSHLKRAMAYGTTMASFNVQDFSTKNIEALERDVIDERFHDLADRMAIPRADALLKTRRAVAA